jgi:hypothetical protein
VTNLERNDILCNLLEIRDRRRLQSFNASIHVA